MTLSKTERSPFLPDDILLHRRGIADLPDILQEDCCTIGELDRNVVQSLDGCGHRIGEDGVLLLASRSMSHPSGANSPASSARNRCALQHRTKCHAGKCSDTLTTGGVLADTSQIEAAPPYRRRQSAENRALAAAAESCGDGGAVMNPGPEWFDL
jgi:hypothetical protein